MSNDEKSSGAGMKWLKRTISVSWKLMIVGAVAAFAVYRLRYAPIPVDSRIVAAGSITAEVMGTGTLEARYPSTISPKITGVITQMLVDQGDRIEAGQLLVTLYDGDLRQQVAMAKADTGATQASLDRASQDIAVAQANAVQARAAFARIASLVSTKAVSDQDLDNATQQKDVAEAQLKAAQLSKTEIERQLLRAQEALRYNQEQLDFTKIDSPYDGLVIRRSCEAGDVAVPGTEIFQIISVKEIWVSAWVDETAMASLAVGQPARVVFRSEPDKSYPGVVTRMAPLADRETREFLVDVTVKQLPKTWAIGQRAEVYIQTGDNDRGLLAPQAAIIWRNDRPGLFVSMNGYAAWRSINLGLRGLENVEVTKGLRIGELVVWSHDPKDESLAEGRAVTLVGVP